MAEERLLCLTTHNEYALFKYPGNETWTVGRASSNNLVLSYAKISNFHCSLKITPGIGTVLTDLSSNGTWVNKILVGKGQKRVMRSGDRVSFNFPGKGFVYLKLQAISPAYSFPSTSIWAKYEKGQELGRGTFGSVYKCIERATGVSYAVKIIDRRRLQFLPGMEQLIQREMGIMKALNMQNDHIVQFKESFDHETIIYLVLEYVGGGDLAQGLRKRLPLSESEAKVILLQICKGVAFIHSQRVAHRDLKPENILMTAEEPPKVKIADFGLAKLADKGTFLKTRCGTPYYLAPEVFKHRDGVYSDQVDSWSIGVIAFNMLTNKLPYKWEVNPHVDVWRNALNRQTDCTLLSRMNLTEPCVEFIRNLLIEDPQLRMPIRAALTHRWLSSGEITPATSFPEATADETLKIPGAYPQSFFK